MRVIRSVAAMQRLARRWRRAGVRVGFVPTMGWLHDGHLSLVRRARQAVGARGRVVLSLFVNPAQFGPREDLAGYPRDRARDLRLCRGAGVDIVFAPAVREMYPAVPGRAFSTWVEERNLSRDMEGAARPGHFRGVLTVVAKLFNLVLPDVAVFGAKDWQQSAVIRRMVRDLNFPVRILVAPTRRERDGLALSSRNQYLTAGQRTHATVLPRAIRRARTAVTGRSVSAARLKADLTRFIASVPRARLDYVEFFDPVTLRRARQVRRGTQIALAVFFGRTRLIDNARL